jgi:hypothetical protein
VGRSWCNRLLTTVVNDRYGFSRGERWRTAQEEITPTRRNEKAFMENDYALDGSVGEKSPLHSLTAKTALRKAARRVNECKGLIKTGP